MIQRDIETIDISRDEWLRKSLSTNFTFAHRKSEFHWVSKRNLGDHIFGVIQRKRMHESHRPPMKEEEKSLTKNGLEHT